MKQQKVNVGYSYTLSGEVDVDLHEFKVYCKGNRVKPYVDRRINPDALREFLIERYDLVALSNDGSLKWIETI